jgi:hypothetical protein
MKAADRARQERLRGDRGRGPRRAVNAEGQRSPAAYGGPPAITIGGIATDAEVTGIRLPTKYRRDKRGGGRVMRSDNLRAAPGWITPDMVKRVLEVAMPVEPVLVPVVPMPRVKPTLRIISETNSVPPSGGKIKGWRGRSRKLQPGSRVGLRAQRLRNRFLPTIEPTVAAASVEPPTAKHALLAGESGAALSCEVAQPRLDQSRSTRPYRRAKSSSEVETETVRQAVVLAPSREPAPSPPARAQPLLPPPGAPRHVAYAARIGAAVAHLRARHFTVRRDDPNAIIASWNVTGQCGALSNEELVGLAARHGLELPA